jgi:hypothetical protein
MTSAPKVFISYASEARADRVLDLANGLCEDGIDAETDHFRRRAWPGSVSAARQTLSSV